MPAAFWILHRRHPACRTESSSRRFVERFRAKLHGGPHGALRRWTTMACQARRDTTALNNLRFSSELASGMVAELLRGTYG